MFLGYTGISLSVRLCICPCFHLCICLCTKFCVANSSYSFCSWLRNYLSWNLKIFNPFPNDSWFLRVCSTSLLKTLWEKEKLLVTSNFSIFHSVFYPFGELSAIFIKSKIVVCKLFQFGRV